MPLQLEGSLSQAHAPHVPEIALEFASLAFFDHGKSSNKSGLPKPLDLCTFPGVNVLRTLLKQFGSWALRGVYIGKITNSHEWKEIFLDYCHHKRTSHSQGPHDHRCWSRSVRVTYMELVSVWFYLFTCAIDLSKSTDLGPCCSELET